MSDPTTGGTRTPHADPTPEPIGALTGAPASIYTQLTGLTSPEGVTAAELALAAGVGRSTAGKALTTLEQHGLAVRTPGGFDGRRRIPDLWHPAPTGEASTGIDSSSDREAASTQPEGTAANPPQPAASGADTADAAADETAPDTPPAPDSSNDEPAADCAADPATSAPPPDGGHDEGHHEGDGNGTEDDPHNETSNHSPQEEDTTAAPTGTSQQQPAPVVAIIPLGEKKRLAPGALRQMVIDHLQAHPGEAFTATKISRAIEKSSGAIANCLVTLARQHIAEQMSERPRTYRLTATEGNG